MSVPKSLNVYQKIEYYDFTVIRLQRLDLFSVFFTTHASEHFVADLRGLP